jgi:hypothetical protein
MAPAALAYHSSDRAEGHDKGKGPVLVVNQVAPVVAGLDAAEGHGDPAGEADGENRGGVGLTEGHESGVPSHLHVVSTRRSGIRDTVGLVVHEDIKVLLLQFQSDPAGNLLGGRSAHDGGKARGGAVDEFDAPLPENDVVRRAQPDVLLQRVLRSWCKNRTRSDSGSPRYISSAKKVAMPASSAGARYGSQMSSVTTGGSSLRHSWKISFMSPSFSTFAPTWNR